MSENNTAKVVSTTASADALKQLVSEIIVAWPSSSPFTAKEVLNSHPELRGNRSAVLDLAYEEFCRRTEAGEVISAEAFAQTFPSIQRSLVHQLHVHQFLEANTRPGDILPLGQWPSAGDHFLGFDLREEIGRGGFSRVFLASERSIGDRTVVVKLSEFGGEEAQILGKLDHPGIIPIYSVRRDDRTGLWAICMPYLGRSTLLNVLDAMKGVPKSPKANRRILSLAAQASDNSGAEPARAFPELYRRGDYVEKVLLIGRQLAEALRFAHGLGICHGDLKPSNVLLTNDGRAMLLDFNLSFGQCPATFVRVGGTLPYMAPEQLRIVAGESAGSAYTPDQRTDLFSLGAVLYELLTGHLPFGPLSSELSRHEIIRQLVNEQQRGPKPLVCLERPVDRHISALIVRCMAVNPSDRPGSSEQLAAELRKLLSLRARVFRWAGAHRIASASAASLAVAVTAAVAFSISMPAASSDASVGRPAAKGQGRVISLEEALAGGIAAMEVGDYPLAVSRFGEALKQYPDSLAVRFWRGRALLLSGDHETARVDFQTILRAQPSAPAAACLAYTYSLDKAHREAITGYLEALDRGLSTAGLWNNLAYSYQKVRELAKADACLERAIDADPELAAAYHNRSQIELARGLRRSDPRAVEWLNRALVSIRLAQEFGGASGELSRDAACVYARLASELRESDPAASQELEQVAIAAARKAVDQGAGRQRLEPILSLLNESRDLREFVESVPRLELTQPEWAESVLVADPLGGAEAVAADEFQLLDAARRPHLR